VKNVERSGHGLIGDTIQKFDWGVTSKITD